MAYWSTYSLWLPWSQQLQLLGKIVRRRQERQELHLLQSACSSDAWSTYQPRKSLGCRSNDTALEDKAYRFCFGMYVSKSTLADADNWRDNHIFEEFASHTMAEARSAGRQTSLSLEATYMSLTQRLSSFAWRLSNGPSIGRTCGKAGSKYIPCTTLRHSYRRFPHYGGEGKRHECNGCHSLWGELVLHLRPRL